LAGFPAQSLVVVAAGPGSGGYQAVARETRGDGPPAQGRGGRQRLLD